MKVCISISILILLLFTQILYIPLSALSFEYNRNYIAQNLCINKSNPKSSCKGCCYLKKEIEQNIPSGNTNQREEISIKIFSFENSLAFNLSYSLFVVRIFFPQVFVYIFKLVYKPVKPPCTFSVLKLK